MSESEDKNRRSLEETRKAVAGLTPTQLVRLRLLATAFVRLLPTRLGWTVDDLIDEAVLRGLRGKRKWRQDQVDIVGQLTGIMRSVASHINRNPWVTRVQSESATDEDPETCHAAGVVQSRSAPGLDPLQLVILNEMVERMRALCIHDPTASRILEGELNGLSGSKLKKALGLGEHEYCAARKRFLRHIQPLLLERLSNG